MIRLGGAASPGYITVFRGLVEYFGRHDLELDWVLYSGWDTMVDAFVSGEIDLAWNGPLSYLKIKRRVEQPCKVVAMRDVDVDLVTHFITRPDSDIENIEDLLEKKFAFGRRDNVETGVLAYHFLKQAGINPRTDLESFSFYDERRDQNPSPEHDVIQRVISGELDAGAISQPTIHRLAASGEVATDDIRIIWSSPGFSHCCFTAQGDTEPQLAQRITDAFLSVDSADPIGKLILEGEHCGKFVPGITEGWEILEKVAEEEGLL